VAAGKCHIAFDFFGTLVNYRAGVESDGAAAARRELDRLGATLDARSFAAVFKRCFDHLEQAALRTMREFSMTDAAERLFAELSIEVAPPDARRFIDAYLEDWSRDVKPWPRLGAFLDALDLPKSVVTNTHDPHLVPRLLRRFGHDPAFTRITTSVAHGFRKPHASIFAAHLAALDLAPAQVVFVGDNPACDYFGPRALGIDAYLIAPAKVSGVPEAHRLGHLFELPARLEELTASRSSSTSRP
jgi:putative hydrolase of the HAD superfamily